LHGIVQLLCQGAFECAGLYGFVDTVFFEQVVKVAVAMGFDLAMIPILSTYKRECELLTIYFLLVQ
jgi:hypothetical protein